MDGVSLLHSGVHGGHQRAGEALLMQHLQGLDGDTGGRGHVVHLQCGMGTGGVQYLGHAQHVLDDHGAGLCTGETGVHTSVDQGLDGLVEPDGAGAAEGGEGLEHVLGDVHGLTQRVQHSGNDNLVVVID